MLDQPLADVALRRDYAPSDSPDVKLP